MKNLLVFLVSLSGGLTLASSPVDSMKELVGLWEGQCQQSNSQSSRVVKASLEIFQSPANDNVFFVYPIVENHNDLSLYTVEWSTHRGWTAVVGKLFPKVRIEHNSVEIKQGIQEVYFSRGRTGDDAIGNLAVLDNVGGPLQKGTFCEVKLSKK